MSLVHINWRPTAKDLRWFGVAMIVGFGILGLLCQFGWWPVSEPRPGAARVFWWVGGVAGGLGLTGHKVALPIYWAWMSVAMVMGTVVSYVLLALVFYVMISAMGFIARLTGRDRLKLRRAPAAASYWQDVPKAAPNPDYERQF